jgi:hypothetical protein
MNSSNQSGRKYYSMSCKLDWWLKSSLTFVLPHYLIFAPRYIFRCMSFMLLIFCWPLKLISHIVKTFCIRVSSKEQYARAESMTMSFPTINCLALYFLIINTSYCLFSCRAELEGCYKWWEIRQGDTCNLTAQICQIELEQLYDFNRFLQGGHQCNILPAGTELCCHRLEVNAMPSASLTNTQLGETAVTWNSSGNNVAFQYIPWPCFGRSRRRCM